MGERRRKFWGWGYEDDTVETAITWDRFKDLHANVLV